MSHFEQSFASAPSGRSTGAVSSAITDRMQGTRLNVWNELAKGRAMNGVIGGYVTISGMRRDRLYPVHCPDIATIEKVVAIFRENDGVMALRASPDPVIDPCELVLFSAGGTFTLMLSAAHEDGESFLTTLSTEGLDHGFVSMLAAGYPRRAVTHDFEVVRRLFREFSAGIAARAEKGYSSR